MNTIKKRKAELQLHYKDVCDENEAREIYELKGTLKSFVAVIRKADGCKGIIKFDEKVKLYYDFKPGNFKLGIETEIK